MLGEDVLELEESLACASCVCHASSSRAGACNRILAQHQLTGRISLDQQQMGPAAPSSGEDVPEPEDPWHVHPVGDGCTGCSYCAFTRLATHWPDGVPLTTNPANLPRMTLLKVYDRLQGMEWLYNAADLVTC